MPLLPNVVNSKLASLGYTEWVTQGANINYIGRVFGTAYKIQAQTKYAVERFATSNHIPIHEPFIGIKKLNINDFIMLDIGANVGTYSIGAISLGAKKVYSIEPGPLFEKMKVNIELNNLCHKITPVRMGLAKAPGTMRWYEDKNNPGNAHLLMDADGINFSKISTKFGDDFVEAEVTTLNRMCSDLKIDKIDLVKIDVEGMEWEVLSSGMDMIKTSLPTLVVETHRVASDMMGYDCLTPMFSALYSLGYKTYSHQKGSFEEFIYPNFDVDTFFIHPSKELL